ncbi:LPXTG cell wall anchor domain-containing protein [Carnobacteriaceae bacterium zg-84]|uniref:LPXTG cell wall anchor domain-containing protein n=1 Tax=Granulicatella sp. zg-84 TaxID=2678503 RepID=UPI0013BFB7F6|nr:LPXTG cell wall anchor domain-containing protein [Granulicatella sp. zg-84]NEW65598.1 LPXTG cell wall anchor domain-containing protein [Granulicatella sp. zg-84]QMI85758.1 LPXTG cell wall anchor domain-containing protein [Carnobacteriaceae bacterium zg-84]
MGLGDRIESINQHGNTGIRVLFTKTTKTDETGTDEVQFGYIFNAEKLYTVGEPEPVSPSLPKPVFPPSPAPVFPPSTKPLEVAKGEETSDQVTPVAKSPEKTLPRTGETMSVFATLAGALSILGSSVMIRKSKKN